MEPIVRITLFLGIALLACVLGCLLIARLSEKPIKWCSYFVCCKFLDCGCLGLGGWTGAEKVLVQEPETPQPNPLVYHLRIGILR